jgi:hypothetical protein
MARKSLQEKLLDAIDSGDTELIKAISAEIKLKTKKPVKKAKKTKKSAPKAKRAKKLPAPPKAPIDNSEEGDIISRPKSSVLILPGQPEPEQKGKQCKTEPFDTNAVRRNRFKDDKSFAKEDIGISGSQGVERGTRKYQPVEVECRICHKHEMVSPALAGVNLGGEWTSYRCNRCCSSGRR